jgi:hypothetical protein
MDHLKCPSDPLVRLVMFLICLAVLGSAIAGIFYIVAGHPAQSSCCPCAKPESISPQPTGHCCPCAPNPPSNGGDGANGGDGGEMPE